MGARFFIILAAALLSACMTARDRRERFVQTHSGMPSGQKQAILSGEVAAGMTPDMVRASWGEPVDMVNEVLQGQAVSTWIYELPGNNYVNIYRVSFVNGQVDEVRLIGTRRYVYSPSRHRRYWRHFPEYP